MGPQRQNSLVSTIPLKGFTKNFSWFCSVKIKGIGLTEIFPLFVALKSGKE